MLFRCNVRAFRSILRTARPAIIRPSPTVLSHHHAQRRPITHVIKGSSPSEPDLVIHVELDWDEVQQEVEKEHFVSNAKSFIIPKSLRQHPGPLAMHLRHPNPRLSGFGNRRWIITGRPGRDVWSTSHVAQTSCPAWNQLSSLLSSTHPIEPKLTQVRLSQSATPYALWTCHFGLGYG
jgi:hypothetical protein